MPEWLIGFILKPLIAVPIFVGVALLARAIHRRMPDSRLKRLLFRRIGP